MIPVLSRAQTRAFDEHTIRACNVPGLLLMENAGRGAAEVIRRHLPQGRLVEVVVVCGAGNNGGDGFVVARQLAAEAKVTAVLVVPEAKVTSDARVNLEAFRGVGGAIVEAADDLAILKEALEPADVIVDALFGTGLDRTVAGSVAAAIAAMNEARGLRVAIDVPSGLNADTGVSMGAAVSADVTVTFGQYKLGLLTPHGARMAGKVEVVTLGVPAAAIADGIGSSARLLEASDVAATLVGRGVDAHKGGAGHVVVFAGSPGKIGACLMASRAAIRAGAGLVTIASWPEVIEKVESQVVEVMTRPIARDDVPGSLDEILEGKRAVVIGPGFGLDNLARAAVEHVLGTWEGPTVVDADALALFEQSPEVFAASKGAPVLTPHPGELGRLLGSSAKDIEADRFGAMRSIVERARCVVVLKGAHTLIGAPEELIVVNPSGNPAMATAGAGDVLSGIIGALLCSSDPFDAACAGVYVHGAAADAWAAKHDGADRGLLAREIAEAVPATMAALARGHGRWAR